MCGRVEIGVYAPEILPRPVFLKNEQIRGLQGEKIAYSQENAFLAESAQKGHFGSKNYSGRYFKNPW